MLQIVILLCVLSLYRRVFVERICTVRIWIAMITFQSISYLKKYKEMISKELFMCRTSIAQTSLELVNQRSLNLIYSPEGSSMNMTEITITKQVKSFIVAWSFSAYYPQNQTFNWNVQRNVLPFILKTQLILKHKCNCSLSFWLLK